MKTTILILMVLLFSGCGDGMNANEISEAIKECEKYDLIPYRFENGLVKMGATAAIFCRPKEIQND